MIQAGKTGLETIRRVSQAGLNKAATTVVSSAIKVCIVIIDIFTFKLVRVSPN